MLHVVYSCVLTCLLIQIIIYLKTYFLLNIIIPDLDGKEKSSTKSKIGKARKFCVMICTYRTMKKRRMQRNAEFGLFTKPL